MNNLNLNDVVAIADQLSIGIIIDLGKDPNGNEWYRTDAEGVKESPSLTKINNAEEMRNHQHNGFLISPSTLTKIINEDLLKEEKEMVLFSL